MSLRYIFCFLDEKHILRDVEFADDCSLKPLNNTLKMRIGLPIKKVFNIDIKKTKGTVNIDGQIYQYYIMENKLGNGEIISLTDEPYKSKIYEEAMDNLSEGIHIFDKNGYLVHYNKTCEKIESLQRENIIGKHLLDIYKVNEEYSTIINTLKTRKPVINRCDIFENHKGDKVYSINSGYPLYVQDEFIGALGVVYDMSILEEIIEKVDCIKEFFKEDKNMALKPQKAYSKVKYYTFEDIIGQAEEFQGAIKIAKKVAFSDSSVLIFGETGTGKEMFAQSIHSNSERKNKEFAAVNCAAIPMNLMEGILFGTVKGAFTDSIEKKGLLEEAEGGTLFLDEINSMDLNMQSKLLRVLQEKKFRRVGGVKNIDCNVRIISAINEDPSVAIENNRLRKDLYYRIGTVSIELPPLRRRKKDIPILIEYFIGRLSKMYFKNINKISKEALNILKEHDWPGNVRELFHVLEYCVNMMEGNTINKEDLPPKLTIKKPSESKDECKKNLHSWNLQEILNDYEKKILENLLEENHYNITKVANILGIRRQSLQYRLKKCNIKCIKTIE